MNSTQRNQELLRHSRGAAEFSYSPYSHFRVGAVIVAGEKDFAGETFFHGANTEQNPYQGLLCGERNAVVEAVTQGFALNNPQFIQAVGVSCIDAPPQFTLSDNSPCGACRQVMFEFARPETPVVIDDKKDGMEFRLGDLLPHGFRFGPAADPSAPHKTPVDVAAVEKEIPKSPPAYLLLNAAENVAQNSYVPNSRVSVGAIVVTADCRAYAGVQIENSSTGLTIGAFRAAVSRAVLGATPAMHAYFKENGQALLTHVAVVSRGHEQGLLSLLETNLLSEFANKDTHICLSDGGGRQRTLRYKNLIL